MLNVDINELLTPRPCCKFIVNIWRVLLLSRKLFISGQPLRKGLDRVGLKGFAGSIVSVGVSLSVLISSSGFL